MFCSVHIGTSTNIITGTLPPDDMVAVGTVYVTAIFDFSACLGADVR